ncbi:MAG: glycosyltransferase family A protein [Melioribacteraceae bacterium]|nr:MAG: glycosyltransferase family A protein [Melioribacteraceae bacterium]
MIQLYKNFTPSVSVVVPTYNREKLLPRALDSILKQTLHNWECIIVDDGSTDNTSQIVNDYLEKDHRFRYMKHANKKPPLTFNTGIQASIGRFVTFLGSDDEYKPEHLQLRFDFMINNPDIDLIQGGLEIIGHPYVKDMNDLSKEIHISECKVGGTFFGKREVFLELEGFRDLKYADDADFWKRAEKKFNVKDVDFPTYIYYRDTPDSICSNIEFS